MNLGDPLTKNTLLLGSLWNLQVDLNGYESYEGDELATQVVSGRSFQFIGLQKFYKSQSPIHERVQVRLLEDGYVCWLDLSSLLGGAFARTHWSANLLTKEQIQRKIPLVLSWIKKQSKLSKKYLWGGTIGPDFDCSGLIQAAYASQGIWIPRDAYQQEEFCKKISKSSRNGEALLPGDLFFFGTSQKCNHVGIHINDGFYWHSSGVTNGHNGIEIDGLFNEQANLVGSYYKSQFRSAGRVISCYECRAVS